MRSLSGVLVLLFPLAALAQRAHIAPTEPLSPEEERKTFTVPPGFEVQLVASEPQIDKPIQHAFDAKGRLWVTTSREYPFEAEPGKGKDKLFILSEFGVDGKAKKVEVFADDLNIPIGVLPLPDCKSCIVFSIPSIWKYTDTDGDGKADKKEELYTGFGHKDTHGLVNSFTLMPDGWVYATHGFSNTSTVKGKDGHEITMQSGHTFRFRLDGSRIEIFTKGQVNPFGIAVDHWFNLYTADCHSKPITQLIRGATYSSFAKPHDGLGFAPHVTKHDHGSTAICGLTWYDADHFPKEYRGNMFLGNVVTNRINADAIVWHGSTPEATEVPDFLVSKDPWFRPVDIKLGPDGALYVTDFYNKIIGHYEVDLKHPQRDKDRGRVWRIVWKGLYGTAKPPAMAFGDLTTEKVGRVDDMLGDPNLTVRIMATLEMIRRNAKTVSISPWPEAIAHGEWANQAPRPGITDRPKTVSDPDRGSFVSAHEIRRRTATEEWLAQYHPTDKRRGPLPEAAPDLSSLPAQVARAWADQWTAVPNADHVRPLVALLKSVPPEDTHLRYAARVALRNSVAARGGWKVVHEMMQAEMTKPGGETGHIIADICLAFPTDYAAAILQHQLVSANVERGPEYAFHIGRYSEVSGLSYGGDRAIIDAMHRIVQRPSKPGQFLQAFTLFRAFLRGCQAGGHKFNWHGGEWSTDYLFQNLAAELKADPAATQVVVDVFLLLREVYAGNNDLLAFTHRFLTNAVSDESIPDASRAAAVSGLAKLGGIKNVMLLGEILQNPKTRPLIKERILVGLAGMTEPSAQGEVKAGLRAAPYRVVQAIAAVLVDSGPGTETLFDAIRTGAVPARVLQDKVVAFKLAAAPKMPKVKEQVAELTKGLPPAEKRLDDLIKKRARSFAKAKPNAKLGAQIYAKSCAACHQIAGQGGKVGPNLDGIGIRGAERLLEDVLDPNRNVDAAFRARVLNLVDGRTITGLMLRIEGKVVVMADAEGKEVRVPEADIEKNTVTNLSPMPANFDTAVSEADFVHLLGYLLELRGK